ncbi:MAG: DUF92 domain-containing protein [Candidatus Altiarchaeota archaeon]
MNKTKRAFVQMFFILFAAPLAYLTTITSLALVVLGGFIHITVIYVFEKRKKSCRSFFTSVTFSPLFFWISIFLVVLLFPPFIAASIWVIVCLGDSAATIIGGLDKGKRLIWNKEKSWEGSLSFFIFSSLGIIALLNIFPFSIPKEDILFYSISTSMLAAIIESISAKIDDNLTVPFGSALFMYSLSFVEPIYLDPALLMPAIIINLALVVVAYLAKFINFSGAIGGFLIGFMIYIFLGLPGFIVLITFFFMGSIASKFGYSIKEGDEVCQEHKGKRSFKHALANCLVGVYLAFLYFASGNPRFILGFVGSFSATMADTISSELGQMVGQKPRLITTFEIVKIGTDGGVTFSGTLLGMVASLLLGVLSMVVGLLTPQNLWIILGAGLAGTTIDSILGAVYERKKKATNEAVNFFCSLSGALFAVMMPVV